LSHSTILQIIEGINAINIPKGKRATGTFPNITTTDYYDPENGLDNFKGALEILLVKIADFKKNKTILSARLRGMLKSGVAEDIDDMLEPPVKRARAVAFDDDQVDQQ